ncbi:spore coat protein CotJB [Turicibacter sp. TJ11]|uniref:spore coat protein CotJB n=1 Tax=Turicibacter sp. TJ11 TaxID=2806443 RepID=UPI001F29A432|nr:spore coat protein CotJB [Turicibacter sp. TJ11]
MNQKQLLKQIQSVSLMAVDLHLFLDTHPTNKEALKDYEKISKQYHMLKKQYEEQFGPLLNFGQVSNFDKYNWTSEPWPWQNK